MLTLRGSVDDIIEDSPMFEELDEFIVREES